MHSSPHLASSTGAPQACSVCPRRRLSCFEIELQYNRVRLRYRIRTIYRGRKTCCRPRSSTRQRHVLFGSPKISWWNVCWMQASNCSYVSPSMQWSGKDTSPTECFQLSSPRSLPCVGTCCWSVLANSALLIFRAFRP